MAEYFEKDNSTNDEEFAVPNVHANGYHLTNVPAAKSHRATFKRTVHEEKCRRCPEGTDPTQVQGLLTLRLYTSHAAAVQ